MLVPTHIAYCSFFFFFQAEDGIRDYKVTGVQTCALPGADGEVVGHSASMMTGYHGQPAKTREAEWFDPTGKRFIRTGDVGRFDADRKSTRLNSSHLVISYAVFCLKKKKI